MHTEVFTDETIEMCGVNVNNQWAGLQIDKTSLALCCQWLNFHHVYWRADLYHSLYFGKLQLS